MRVGDVGVDFAKMPTTGYRQIAADGLKFVSRYSDGGHGDSKCARLGEPAEAMAVGVDFLANFELAESTPTLGASMGEACGAADRTFWNEVGLAPGAGVAVSWEPGTDTSKWSAVAAFLAAYRTAVCRPLGMYSNLATLLHMRAEVGLDLTWLSMAAAASGHPEWGSLPQSQYAANMQKLAADNGIHLCQNRNRRYGTGADEDVITAMPAVPWSHMQALQPKKRDEMPSLHCNDGLGNTYVLGPNYESQKHMLTPLEEDGALLAIKAGAMVEIGQVTPEFLQSIPEAGTSTLTVNVTVPPIDVKFPSYVSTPEVSA